MALQKKPWHASGKGSPLGNQESRLRRAIHFIDKVCLANEDVFGGGRDRDHRSRATKAPNRPRTAEETGPYFTKAAGEPDDGVPFLGARHSLAH